MPVLKLPRIPRSRLSLNTPPSKHKALLIGIDYTSTPDQPGRKYRFPKLRGQVRNVKEMKWALIGVYNYPEDGIFVMTDEEQHKDTLHWPSEANILQAIANLVDGASPGDAFIFYYAGHSGQQPAEKDTREIDGLDEFIVTWDGKIILDDTLRECLVDRLPDGTRLTAILDACHSGTLLDLEHYSCHWFLRRRCQSLTDREKPVAPSTELVRRHTEAPWQVWPVRNAAPLPRVTFPDAAMTTPATVSLKFPKAKMPDDPKDDPPSPPERPLCGGWYCAYTLLRGPLVISVSACSDNEDTFEDSQGLGKGMTRKLIKILRKDPSIKVGDLNQQLHLFKLAIKRVCEAKKTFERVTKKLSPEQKKKLKDKYTAKGLFEFKPQTSQIGSLHSLSLTNGAYQQSLDEQLILKRRRAAELLG